VGSAVRRLLALLLFAAPLNAAAEGLLPGGVVDVKITPAALVLGKDARAQVTLSVTDPAGNAVDVEGLEILASAGRVEPVEHVATGRYTALYRPPRVGFPHIAWILAKARAPSGAVAGVALLPLMGQGTLRVDTKPDAQVTLRIGEDVFGPVTADRRGVARITVVAPPGSTIGTALSVDAAGNETTQTVDLAVPPFNRIALLPMGRLTAGGRAPLLLLAVSGDGTALPHGDFHVSADRASVAEIRKLADGVWRVELQGPEKVENGHVQVRAELEGHGQSVADRAIPVVAGPAAQVRVHLAPAHHRAVDVQPVTVTAHFQDAHGNPVSAQGAQLTPSLGTLDAPRFSGGGVVRARWTFCGPVRRHPGAQDTGGHAGGAGAGCAGPRARAARRRRTTPAPHPR